MESPAVSLQERAENSLLEYIQANNLKEGDRLGSTPELAREFGVSAGTLQKVLQQLARRGIINRTCKAGTYLAPHFAEKLKRTYVDQTQIKTIVFVVPDIRLSSFASLSAGVQEFSHEADVDVITISTENRLERYVDTFERYMNRRSTGFLVVPPLVDKIPLELIYEIHRREIPIVTCYRKVEGSRWPVVYTDDMGASRLMAKHLSDCGCRRIGYIAPHRQNHLFEALHYVFVDQLISLGRVYNPDWRLCLSEITSYADIVNGKLPEKREAEISQWLAKYADQVDGIACAGDEIAYLAIKGLYKLGKRIPEDVAVIGGGHLISREILPGEITSVSVDYRQMGQEALRLLNLVAEGNDPGTEYEVYVPELVVAGSSTPPILGRDAKEEKGT